MNIMQARVIEKNLPREPRGYRKRTVEQNAGFW
jgi:hypothetical protein